jgi:hypothetical protein
MLFTEEDFLWVLTNSIVRGKLLATLCALISRYISLIAISKRKKKWTYLETLEVNSNTLA